MSYLANRKSFPDRVTSYDVLKAVAVLLMIVDHVGMHFFPEHHVLRLIGRMCVPMWFFLVGYASSRDLSPTLWIGGLILVLANGVIGVALLPLNILFSIIFVRLVLDRTMQAMLKSRYDCFMGAVALAMFYFPLTYVFEYSTAGIALAMVGYLARRKQELNFGTEKTTMWLCAISLFFFATQSISGFNFSDLQYGILLVGTTSIIWFLYLKFKPYTFASKSPVISFLGRYTLEIYVVHLVMFKFILAFSGDFEQLQWFNFYLFPGDHGL